MKYLSKLSRRMASMLCIPFLLASLAVPSPRAAGADRRTRAAAAPVRIARCGDGNVRQSAAGLHRDVDAPWNALPELKPGVSSEGFRFAAGQANTLSLVAAPDAPLSAPSALRIGFPRGAPGGGAPSRWGSSPFRPTQGNVYVCVWVRMSADYSNNGNVGHEALLHARPVEQSLRRL